MAQDVEISMDELADYAVDPSLKTLSITSAPTGEYIAKVYNATGKQVDKNSDYSPGRLYFNLVVSLHDIDAEGRAGARQGKAFVKVSFMPRGDGELDLQAKLYAQLEIATDIVDDPKGMLTFLKSGEASFVVWGKESFRPSDSWEREYLEAGEEDQRAAYAKDGYVGEFNVFQIKPLPEEAPF